MPIASCGEAIVDGLSHFSPAMQALAEKLVLERPLISWALTYISPNQIVPDLTIPPRDHRKA